MRPVPRVWAAATFAVYLGLFMSALFSTPAWAETTLEEARRLLEKGLTIHEIDRELERLAQQEKQIAAELETVTARIAEQERQVAVRKEAAGKVLRSYYMGYRETLYLSLLKMDSLYDALAALDFMTIIFRHDQHRLLSYRESLLVLNGMKEELLQTEQTLQQVKTAYLSERERLVRLQEELETELAFLPEPEAESLREQIADVTSDWQSRGLPLFEKYLGELSAAMMHLPDILATNEDYLRIENAQFVFRISDDQLNRFLRDRNAIFENLTFSFADGVIAAHGEESGTEVSIRGRYAIDNDPANRIRFHVDELQYNGLTLPDTTVKDLEERFDLGIYPEKFQVKAEATDVAVENRILTVWLKPTGNWLKDFLNKLF